MFFKWMISIATLSLLFFFQNCGENVDFSSRLVAKTDTGTATNIDLGDGHSDEPMDPVDEDNSNDVAESEEPPGHGNHGNHDVELGDGHQYICILEGPGRSVRVGFVEGGLEAVGSTPSDVCMSRHACESLISEAFNVKEAHFRGFCPDRNPHVVSLSDGEIADLLD